MAKEWFVVHAYSSFEKQVKKTMEEHIQLEGMDEFFEDILVPSEEVVEIRDGKKQTSERRFFPGYVLVKMDMNENTWQLIRHLPRVLGFIGGTSYPPIAIKQSEVDSILSRIREGEDNPKPKITYEASEVIRITDGPFNDFEAVIEEVDYDKSRLEVSVTILGRLTRVGLEFNQVQKI